MTRESMCVRRSVDVVHLCSFDSNCVREMKYGHILNLFDGNEGLSMSIEAIFNLDCINVNNQ